MTAKKWNYRPLGETIGEAAASVASAAVFGVALSQIFNPLALGAVIAYGAGRTAYDYYGLYGQRGRDAYLKKGYVAPLPDQYKYVQEEVDKLTEEAGLPKHPVMLATSKTPNMIMPWYLRWTMSDPGIRKKIFESMGAVDPVARMVIVSPQFLQKHSKETLRFVLAHEVSHAKAGDSYTPKAFVREAKKYMMPVLIGGMAVAAASSVIGLGSLSILTAGLSWVPATLGLMAAATVTNIGINFASRIAERRADRNGLYLSGQKNAAIDYFTSSRLEKGTVKPTPVLMEVNRHPTAFYRIEHLKKVWNDLAQYPQASSAVARATQVDPAPRKRTAANDPWALPEGYKMNG